MTPSSPALRLTLAAAGFGLVANFASAQENQLEINVRPKVVDKAAMWAGKTPAHTGGHGKIYGILSVQEVKAEHKLVRKVDEAAITVLLSQELNRNGPQSQLP